MTSSIDICNRALAEMGARATIASLQDPTPQAVQCNLFYDHLRKKILRMAPWNFARQQVALTQLGDGIPDGTAPYPWQWMYAYPADCLKFMYLLPPPPPLNTGVAMPLIGGTFPAPLDRPMKGIPFYIWNSPAASGVKAQKVVLTNLYQATGVYVQDVQDTTVFDEGFTEALTCALAAKLVLPLSGNVGLKDGLFKQAEAMIIQARVDDANEGLSTTDHVPDWMQARGIPFDPTVGPDAPMIGSYFNTWDVMTWGA